MSTSKVPSFLLTAGILAFAAVCSAVDTEGEDETRRVLNDFSGFGATADVEGFAGARNLKQAEGRDEFEIVASLTEGIQRTQDSFAGLLSNDGISGLGDSKKEKLLGGLGDKGFKDGKFGLKDKKGKKDLGGKYDKTKGVLSRILNLMGVDVGPDPLQDLVDAGERQRDSTAKVAGAFSSVLSSNVDNVMNERQNVDAARENLRASKRGMNDVRIQNEADRWKAILRNFINIDKGFSDLEEEARKFADDTCAPAEFVPPERLPASFSGLGASIEFNAGQCTVEVQNKFLDWELVLECVRPSIKYTKAPPMYVSEHTTASEFKTRECKKTRTFGEEVEEVLHVFDGSRLLDPSVVPGVLGQSTLTGGAGRNQTSSDPMANILRVLLGDGVSGIFDKKKPKKKFGLMDISPKDGKLSILGAKKLKSLGLFKKKSPKKKLTGGFLG